MKPLVRGQRIKLADLAASGQMQWTVDASIEAAGKCIDWCCFGLDEAGKLNDENFFVFYNQPSAPKSAIQWKPLSDTHATFSVDLTALPPTIRRLVFTASIDGIGSMNQIRSGLLRLASPANEGGEYRFSGTDFLAEAALIVGEIYWKSEWRFAAVGQGFEGGLGALLRHFGGEVLEEPQTPPASNASTSQPTPTPTRTHPPVTHPHPPVTPPPITLPPPPISSPVTTSLPVNPPVIPQSVARGSSLQALIDAAAPGSTVVLMRDEYQGPLSITKPLTLEGKGSVLWASQGPVVTVQSLGVTLRDLEIEVTVPEDASGEGDIALKTAPSAPPRLENVRVRGRVMGMGEDGDWSLPATLQLGRLAPRALNDYRLSIRVPVSCTLQTPIAGIQLQPRQLSPGEHEIVLQIENVAPETLILGHIEVQSPTVTRSIPLMGHTLGADGMPPARQLVLWQG